MAKQRFRNIKQGRSTQEKADNHSFKKRREERPKRVYATKMSKLKAFLTDSFMLVMPIMYAVFYLVMGGREGFAAHKALGWLYILIPLVIVQTLFMFKTGQTPGYRTYEITLIDEHTGERPSLFIIFFRNAAAILSLFTIFGWLMMFFRKDGKTLHDLLSNTAVIQKSSTK